MEKSGEQFLHHKDPTLHTIQSVEHEKERKKRLDEEVSQKPADKIADWLEVIKKTHMGHREDPQVLERIKKYYHKEYVIKLEDIPESYFDNQRRIAREQGHGNIDINEEQRYALSEVLINDQKTTLDNWINYLSSSDSDSFPMWAKYWAFKGMTKLSSYDKEKHQFGKRKKDTVAPFPDLNREALAYVVDVAAKQINKDGIKDVENNPELEKLLQGMNFGKLYAYAIEKVTPTAENGLTNTNGEWVKYDKGSDHMPLVESLQGHGTGWCTAGETTAQSQLQGGDFYVYYSEDEEGNSTIPRVAIRMQSQNIGEIRGIAHEQNIDPYIANTNIVDNKLKEFGDKGEKYKKKSADMKRLTSIEKAHIKGDELSKDDLRFLYEIDNKIKGFGYQDDPRIKEIISTRDIKLDISQITGYPKEKISTTQEEVLKGDIKFHYGDLDLYSLKSAEGLKLPETVNGDLSLANLSLAEGLKLPETINGDLSLANLSSAEGLKLPEMVSGNLYLGNLSLAEGLKLPETVNGGLDLSSLNSAEGLKLPETINGDLDLSSLSSAEGLKLPETINGSLYLSSLSSAKGLKLPETIGGYLDLRSLSSAEGLELPETVGGYLDLRSLSSAKGLKLPETVGGGLYLGSLSSAEGLKLPETVGGGLDLRSLSSAEGLKLPETVGGSLYLNGLSSAEKEKLKEKYPNLNI